MAALGVCLFAFKSSAQDFTLTVDHTTIVDTVGSEMIFEFEAVNTSNNDLTLFIARTLNDIPENWQSSLCFEYCFAPFVDTIETTSQWGSSPLAPEDTAFFSVHVLALVDNGTGNLIIVVGDVNNISDTISYNLTASTQTSAVKSTDHPNRFDLSQNYPNPFNPSTKIKFSLAADSKVSVRVYNLLGQQVTILLNGEYTAGRHEINFDASGLSSGIYFYVISAAGKDGSNFTSTKKMTLMK